MVTFPGTPSLNQQIPGPGGQLWEWDGVKWIAISGSDAPADGNIYGRQNNAWAQVPSLEGSTDGSEAAPGEVGEVLTGVTNFAYNTTTFSLQGGSTSYVLVTLTPGDWDVTVRLRATDFSAGINFAAFRLSLTPPPNTTGAIDETYTAFGMAAWFGDFSFASPPWRMNVTVPTPVSFALQQSGSAGWIYWRAYGYARRMR